MIWPAYVRDRDPLPFTPKIAEIQRIMCEHFEVSREDMFSLRRGTKVLWARHVAIYFARRLTMHSFPEIGRMFGKRDHSTILSAVRKMEHLIEKNEGIAAEIARLTDKIMMASS
jgi:chromosomal replication initiator protein